MPPQELARRLQILQNKTNELLICLIATSKSAGALISALDDAYELEELQAATKTFGTALNYTNSALGKFCDVAGSVFE